MWTLYPGEHHNSWSSFMFPKVFHRFFLMVLINPKWLALTEINTQQCYVVVCIPYKMVALAAQAQAFEKHPPKPLAPPCNWGSTIHTLVQTGSIELSSIKVSLWNTCTEKIYKKSGTAKTKRTSPESCADGCDLRHKTFKTTLYKKHIFNTTFKIHQNSYKARKAKARNQKCFN